MLTQIHEISSPEEARGVSEIGIDHVGILVGDSEFPREQPLSRAAKIAAAIVAPARVSALFLAVVRTFKVEFFASRTPSCWNLKGSA